MLWEQYHTHGASMYVTLCNTGDYYLKPTVHHLQYCAMVPASEPLLHVSIHTQRILYIVLISSLFVLKVFHIACSYVICCFSDASTFSSCNTAISLLWDFYYLDIWYQAVWFPSHTHTHTPLSHTQTPISPLHLPDNIRVLEGFKLPQYRHLPDRGERHPLLFRLDTNSFQGYEASSVLQISRFVYFPISAFSNLGHRLILSTCTVFVHFCGFVLCLPPSLTHSLSSPVENITGNPGEGDEPESSSQRHIHRTKLAHAMPRWQGDTDGGRHHLCQICSNWAPGRQQQNCHHVLFRLSTQELGCVPTSTPPPPITHSNSCPPTTNTNVK